LFLTGLARRILRMVGRERGWIPPTIAAAGPLTSRDLVHPDESVFFVGCVFRGRIDHGIDQAGAQ